MKSNDPSTLPELAIPAGVSADVAEDLRSPSGTDALQTRLTAHAGMAVQSGKVQARFRRMIEACMGAGRYMRLRDQALRARRNIDADKEAAQEDIKALNTALQRAEKAHQAAVAAHAATAQKMTKLNGQIGALVMPGGVSLHDAQIAFDKAMINGSEEAQHRAALALHEAEQADAEARAAAAKKRAPLELMLNAQAGIAERQLVEIEDAQLAVERARAEVFDAEHALAMVEADEATYGAAVAHLRARASWMQTSRLKPQPLGFDAPSFYFSSTRRALATSNVLTNMGPEGPVLLDGRVIGALAASAVVPDLSVFVESAETV